MNTSMRLKGKHQSRLLLLPAALLALSLSSCIVSPATTTRESSFNVPGSAELNVSSLNGRIEITTGSGNTVAVKSILRDADRLKYEAVQNGNQITVSASHVNGWWWTGIFGGPAADIHVTVPSNTTLTLETSNGRITVDGTTAGGTLKTSNGAVTVQNATGRFSGSTSNGKIQITGLNGSGLFRTSNGAVALQDVTGEFDASTSNGAITFVGDMISGGQNRLATSNGAVTVTFKNKPNISLDASTSNGEIECAFPILTTQSGSTRLAGTIGTGDAKLLVRTSNGKVSIK